MRAPFQVIVIPYCYHQETLKFLIGKRADDDYWQTISGGGEDSETPLEAAMRELKEETGLVGEHWLQLQSMCNLPKIHYKDHTNWSADLLVVPEYAFMVSTPPTASRSSEHSELAWLSYHDAYSLLKYDSNRNALWEVGYRLKSQT